MVIQNAPSGYVGMLQPNLPSSSNGDAASSPNPVKETITQATNEPTPELKVLETEIRKTERAIKTAPEQSKDYLVDHLKDLQQERSDLIHTGNAYTTQLKNIQEGRAVTFPTTSTVGPGGYTQVVKNNYGVITGYRDVPATPQTSTNLPGYVNVGVNLQSTNSPNTVTTQNGNINKGESTSVVRGEHGSNFNSGIYYGSPNSSSINNLSYSNRYQESVPHIQRTSSPQETINYSSPVILDIRSEPKPNFIKPTSEVFGNLTSEQKLNVAISEAHANQQLYYEQPQGGLYVVENYALSFGKGFKDFFTHPVESVKGVFDLVTKPHSTIEAMSESAAENPVGFLGETTGNIAAGNVAGRVVGSAVPRVSTTEIPQVGGTPTKVTTYSYDVNGRSFIVAATKESEGPSVSVFRAAPNVQNELRNMPSQSTNAEGIRISTPAETKTLRVNLQRLSESSPELFVNPTRASEYIPSAQNIIRKTVNVENKFTNTLAQGTEGLPKEGVDIVLGVAKEENGLVSGSFSRSGQLAKEYNYGGETYILNKVPKDIDIHLTGSPEYIQTVAQKTVDRLKQAGYDAELKGEGGVVQNAILVKQPSGETIKAVEFLGEGTIPEASIPPDTVLGFQKSGKPTNIEGVQTTTLNEELRGVLQGTARLRKTETGLLDIYPREGRVKDIGSASVSARTLQQSKTIDLRNLQGDINKFESLYPEDLVKSQVTKATAEPERVILADYRSSSKTTSGLSTTKSTLPSLGISLETYPSPSTVKEEISTGSSSNISPSSSESTTPSESGSIIPSTSENPSNDNKKSIIPSESPSPNKEKTISTSLSMEGSDNSINSITSSPSSSSSPSPSESSSIPSVPSAPSLIYPGKPDSSPHVQSLSPKLESKKKKGSKFDVFVRHHGKFELEQSGIGDIGEAFKKGFEDVKKSAAASFKIVEEGKGTVDLNLPGNLSGSLYKSAKERGTFIQPRSQRIGTSGEKREITFKGITANRERKGFNNTNQIKSKMRLI